MKSNRSLPLMLFLTASVVFMTACSFTGLIPAVRKFALPALRPTAAPQNTPPTAPAQPPPSNPPVVVPAAPVTAADAVYQAAKAAWAKQQAAGPHHVSQTAYAGGIAVMNIEADSVPPNYHQLISALGNPVAEQYIYDGTIYNKMNGQWTKLAGGGTAFKSVLAGLTEGLSDQTLMADGKVVGVETINGKPATEYSFTTTVKGLSVPPVTHTLWVDNASGLPVKQEIIEANLGKTVQVITYDDAIRLTLPDEAKNAVTAQ